MKKTTKLVAIVGGALEGFPIKSVENDNSYHLYSMDYPAMAELSELTRKTIQELSGILNYQRFEELGGLSPAQSIAALRTTSAPGACYIDLIVGRAMREIEAAQQCLHISTMIVVGARTKQEAEALRARGFTLAHLSTPSFRAPAIQARLDLGDVVLGYDGTKAGATRAAETFLRGH